VSRYIARRCLRWLSLFGLPIFLALYTFVTSHLGPSVLLLCKLRTVAYCMYLVCYELRARMVACAVLLASAQDKRLQIGWDVMNFRELEVLNSVCYVECTLYGILSSVFYKSLLFVVSARPLWASIYTMSYTRMCKGQCVCITVNKVRLLSFIKDMSFLKCLLTAQLHRGIRMRYFLFDKTENRVLLMHTI
jgi:hypothetical protein